MGDRGSRSVGKAAAVGLLVGVVAFLVSYFAGFGRSSVGNTGSLGVSLFVGVAMAVTVAWSFYRRGWKYFSADK